jgi:hypothetical protein
VSGDRDDRFDRRRLDRGAADHTEERAPNPGKTTLAEQHYGGRDRFAAVGNTPGRTTLVQREQAGSSSQLDLAGMQADFFAQIATMSSGSVQRDGDDSGKTTADPAAFAAAGMQGPGERLPHFDEIQGLFGGFDISNVRAHVGGAATAASRALGANAYAHGDHVAFASSPDLHTAAHEAAHVVQQRGGVQLEGGIDGGAGDPYEQHADAVADRVVRGESAEALLGAVAGGGSPSAAVQRDRAGVGSSKLVARGGFALTKVAGSPTGAIIASARVDATLLGVAQRGAAHEASAMATLLVSSDAIVLVVQVGADHWTASVTAGAFFEQLVGASGTSQLGSPTQLARDLPKRVTAVNERVRINVWGKAPDESFVVLDLARVVAGASRGSLDGLRPVEAHLELGAAGGVDVFADKAVAAATAIPGEPLGGWIDLPSDPALLAVLATSETSAKIVGGVFYEAGGHLRFAVKPNAEAKTGVACHVELAYIAEKLGNLGEHAAAWAKKLVAGAAGKAADLLRVLGGKLHFELPEMSGTWFDFDLHVVLPHLFRGGGFDLSALLPTGFHIDLHGLSLGALPKGQFRWLQAPTLGGFAVPWQKLAKLVAPLGSLHAPRLPQLDFGLHLAGPFTLGLGIDLGAAWAELGDTALGFELDLRQLLGALGDAGSSILRELHAAGEFAQTWVHLGSDGVLRIYDRAKPGGTMVGFHLMKLLDGVQPSALVPTELRWNGGAEGVEMGSVGKDGAAGKATPQKPSGTPIAQRTVDAPAAIAAGLGLSAGAKATVELFYDGTHLTIWSEAPSKLYGSHEGVRSTVDTKQIAATLAKHWPQGTPPATDLAVKLDAKLSKDKGAGFAIEAGKLRGHALWTFEQLLGATDWTALVPTELAIEVDGAGGVAVGAIHPPGDPLGGRFAIHAPSLRKTLLHADGEEVWAGVHYAPDLIAVSVTKSETEEHDGAMAEVHISFLLRQLEKLGKAGLELLDKIAKKVGIAGGNLLARLEEIGAKIGKQLLKLADGVLHFDIGGYFVEWDLKLQLPQIGLDLGKLLPTGFRLPMPGLPNVGLALRATGSLVGELLHRIHLPDLHLGALIPNIDLKSLQLDIRLNGNLLALWADLGKVFGDIDMSFGFDVPLDNVVAAIKKVAGKLGEAVKSAQKLSSYFHVGDDGVLRIYDPAKPGGDRVGIDLVRVFASHGAAESLIPSEVHLETGVGEMSYGEATKDGDAKKAEPTGKVLVSKPSTGQIGSEVSIDAPPWLAEYLGADHPGAKVKPKIRASIYIVGQDVIAFAAVDGSDRGAEVKATVANLARAVSTIALGKDDHADPEKNPAPGMFVINFGRADGTHGHVGWKLARLFADPSLAALSSPDDLEIDAKDGLSVRRESTLDISGLVNRGAVSLDGMAWAAGLLGDSKATRAAAYTSANLSSDVRIALVALEAKHTAKPAGIDLHVPKDLVARLQRRVQSFEQETARVVSRTVGGGASELAGGAGFHASLTAQGIRLDRASTATADAAFAVFSWAQLAHVAGGALDAQTLVPDELHLATKSMAFTLDALPGGAPATMPPSAIRVRDFDPMLAGPLEGVGLAARDGVAIDKHASKIRDPRTHRLALVGAVYHASAGDETKVERATHLELDIDLQAVLHHFLPGHHLGKTAADPTASHRTTFGGNVDAGGDGLDVSLEVKHLTKSGHVDTFKLEAGWTLDQLINLVIARKSGSDSSEQGDQDKPTGTPAASLAPEKLQGQFSNEEFRITLFVNNTPYRSDYNCGLVDVPFIGALVGTLLPEQVVNAAILHLRITSLGELKKKIADLKDGFLALGGCAIEIPGDDKTASRFYGINLELSIKALAPLLALIPGLGEVYAIAKQLFSALKDPAETLDKLLYTPELLYDLAKLSPEIWASMKEKGWKRAALAALESGDTPTRQLVMAMRIVRKLGPDWHKVGDKTPNNIGDVSADYLEWLSEQDVDALRAMPDLDAELKQAGIDPPDDFTVPKQNVSAAEIQARIDQLAAGFTKFADAKDKADRSNNPKDEAAAAAAAEALRKQTATLIKLGARGSTVADPSQGTAHVGSSATADVGDVGPFDVSKLPKPTPDQDLEAHKLMHGAGVPDKAMTPEHIEYLAQKFAWLSTDQLAELLATNSTSAKTDKGIVAVPMFADERPFVRSLFDQRRGVPVGDGAAKASETARDDAKRVAGYRAKSAEVQQARDDAAASMGLNSDGTEVSDGRVGDGHAGDGHAGDGTGHGSGGSAAGMTNKPGAGDGGGGGDGDSETDSQGADSDQGASHANAGKGAGTPTASAGASAAAQKPGDHASSVADLTYMEPGYAQKLVRFDPKSDRMEIRQDAADAERGLITDQATGRRYLVTGVKLASSSVHGSGAAKTVEYTLEVDVETGAAGGATKALHTYTYAPATNTSTAGAQASGGPAPDGQTQGDGPQMSESQAADYFTHMPPSRANGLVQYNAEGSQLTLNESAAGAWSGTRIPDPKTGAFRIRTIQLRKPEVITKDNHVTINYTLEVDVESTKSGKSYQTFHSYTYVPGEGPTGQSYEHQSDLGDLGRQLSAALHVEGTKVKIASKGPFSSGPYVVTIQTGQFDEIMASNPEFAWLLVLIHLDKGPELSLFDLNAHRRVVIKENGTALIRVGAKRVA